MSLDHIASHVSAPGSLFVMQVCNARHAVSVHSRGLLAESNGTGSCSCGQVGFDPSSGCRDCLPENYGMNVRAGSQIAHADNYATTTVREQVP